VTRRYSSNSHCLFLGSVLRFHIRRWVRRMGPSRTTAPASGPRSTRRLFRGTGVTSTRHGRFTTTTAKRDKYYNRVDKMRFGFHAVEIMTTNSTHHTNTRTVQNEYTIPSWNVQKGTPRKCKRNITAITYGTYPPRRKKEFETSIIPLLIMIYKESLWILETTKTNFHENAKETELQLFMARTIHGANWNSTHPFHHCLLWNTKESRH